MTETFATMAERMAAWTLANFRIRTRDDLDRYTYAVSGTLVLMLSDLWAWYDGTRADRTLGIAYGRALQVVNITKDRGEDLGRGVDFWPDGWDLADMHRYACAELILAGRFVARFAEGPARDFHAAPLAQARQVLGQAAKDHPS